MIPALLLEPAGDSGNYRRIGLGEVPTHKELAEKGWEIKDATII